MVGVIEEQIRIYSPSFKSYFEMQVLGCGTSGTPCQTYNLSCLNLLTLLNVIAGLVTITCREPVGMAYYDIIAISEIWSRLSNNTVESRKYFVVRTSFDVYS